MNKFYPFDNPPLPYAYDALEPYIDTKTMKLHHDKHLQAYVDNLNRLLENSRFQNMSLEQLIYNADRLPEEISVPIRNNAGGVYNHWFYFEGMGNSKVKLPIGNLLQAINNEFGGFEKFKDEFSKAAMSVFGSGYAWLVNDDGKLKIITTPNQNNPIAQGLCPILTIDVWEHAYYLKNYNVRKEYIDNWFNVVNWEVAENNYNKCKF
ncbi:MAG: superoxide dismutase [Lachnospiraceae bacterium]|nr:superoxide dismutase [Lachnospiraceae bacterium]